MNVCMIFNGVRITENLSTKINVFYSLDLKICLDAEQETRKTRSSCFSSSQICDAKKIKKKNKNTKNKCISDNPDVMSFNRGFLAFFTSLEIPL